MARADRDEGRMPFSFGSRFICGMWERRERPNWGLASLLRPARAAPGVPSVGVATALKPERMPQRSTWHDLRWLHAMTLRIDIASLPPTRREILIKVNSLNGLSRFSS